LAATRTQTVARLHQQLAELVPGGAKRRLDAKTAAALLRRVRPADAAGRCRRELARELLEDLRRVDARLAENEARIQQAVAASGTTLTVHQGVGQDYYRRKLAEGKTRGEARRALKRHLANIIYATLVADQQRTAGSPGGHMGAALQSSAAGPTPTASTSDKSLPGLEKHPTTAVA
jgi:hypothetical protein